MVRALLSGLLLLVATRAAADEPQFEVRWKLPSSGLWPPAIAAGRVVVKTGDTVAAYQVHSGRLLWTRQLSDLELGEGTIAAGDRYVYVLGQAGLELLDLKSGQSVAKRPVGDASGVLFQGGSVYLATRTDLQRLDENATRVLQRAPGLQGELRGADGDYVAVYRADKGPRRLTVVNLRAGKVAFEFKLFPSGTHRVARMAGGRIVFIDYTQAGAKGGKRGDNPRKLYYTEADYILGRKLRDISLGAKYTSSSADVFWISAASSGRVFLANYGKGREESTLFAFDPEHDQTLWTRSGDVAGSGLTLHGGRLWTTVSASGGESQLVAYSPETGDVVSRLPLDGPAIGSGVSAGRALLVRTRGSIYCVAPRGGEPRSDAVGAVGAAPRPGPLRLYRDRVAGYLIQVPESWTFDRAGLRKLGGVRFVIPFVRSEPGGGKLATVHILTWEAAGRDAEGLWRSVEAQRLRTDPHMRVVKVVRLPGRANGGGPAVIATYVFRSPQGEPVQMRSLCLVSHGVAFELRGWVSPSGPPEVWQEVEDIFRTFQPKPPGSL